MDCSIVIPAFNEKKRLPSYLYSLVDDLSKSSVWGVEIIVVDDGSSEEDRRCYSDIVELLKDRIISIKILRHPKSKGKGAAIQTGFNIAAGDWIGFVDADGSTPSQEVIRLIKIALSSYNLDGVFGSRIRMLGYNINRKLIRHLSGRFFVTIAHMLLGIPFYDPQCGCKLFRKSKILPFLKICKEQGYLLDIELISLGYFNKLNFLEVPISWRDIPGSKVNLIKDSFSMVISLWNIRRQLMKMGII